MLTMNNTFLSWQTIKPCVLGTLIILLPPQARKLYASIIVNPQLPPLAGNPVDSDSFLISNPWDYDNGVQTQGQF